MPLAAPTDLHWSTLLPALILTGGALVLLFTAMSGRVSRAIPPSVALITLAAAAFGVFRTWRTADATLSFGGMMTGDSLSLFGTILFIAAAALTVMHSTGDRGSRRVESDYYSLILFATAGMAFMAGSTDLVTFLLSLELLSIAFYVLMGLESLRPGATEAAVKYFLLGAFASAFAIYGTALLYGATGTTSLARLAAVLPAEVAGRNLLALAGLAMLTVGLGFKISMVPFHAWTPDVYQGASTPIAGFLSTGSKAAVLVVMIRVFGESFHGMRVSWVDLIAVLGLITMALGNITALRQLDVKRMLAFSSIAHVGYLLAGIAAAGADGASGVLFYLVGYTAMNLTAFGVVLWLERERSKPITVSEFSGLAGRSPMLAAGMAIALFSLAGVPPTVGFVGKFYLFRAAVRADLTWLAVAGVLNSVISLYYYLRIVVHMYMKPDEAKDAAPARGPLGSRLALALSTILILVLGIFPNSVLRLAQAAAAFLG